MVLNKDTYLDSQIAEQLQTWVSRVLVLAIILFAFIGLADFVTAPRFLGVFFLYRLGISAVLLVLYLLNRLKRNIAYQYAIITTATVLSSVTIELMILKLGGHSSPYYMGQNLVIIAALGLIPFNLILSLAIAAAIYAIYLVPILVFDTITNPEIFISNNIFMISTFSIALTWRILTQKSMLNELSLQYDLAQEKDKLKDYSSHLEELVDERTKELNKSEQWHRSLLENATDGILVLDRDGIIVNANQRACELHGFSKESLIGAHIRLLETDSNREKAEERMRRILAGESLVFEAVHNRKDGGKISLEISSKAIAIGDEVFIQSFYRDITEKKKVQEHLFQSQKLESIGVLAGGVAHDFNNILTAILGYTEVIRKQSEGNEKIIRSLNIIESAARKSGRMISQLLDFSRKKTHETVPFNLNDVVGDTVRLLARVIDKRITLTELLDGALPPVEGDVNQMEQVLMNLIVNARDAMPDGGRILINTGVVVAGKGLPDVPPYIPAGRYVLLRIADTGSGIPPEIRDKIFEPFFTTKERGKGTGLGLSMVYGVVREHNGFITVQSAPNTGTTFSIYLPALDKVAAADVRKADPSALEGHETILVVDDEEGVLNFVKESLEIYGYRVLALSDPVRALETFKREHRKIDLVITDIIMPALSGKDLLHKMRAIDPAARVLEISTFGRIIDLPGESAPDGFVQKPFEAPSLASAVRKVLDSHGKVLNNN
jgi:PAS domain S-box-containing protein